MGSHRARNGSPAGQKGCLSFVDGGTHATGLSGSIRRAPETRRSCRPLWWEPLAVRPEARARIPCGTKGALVTGSSGVVSCRLVRLREDDDQVIELPATIEHRRCCSARRCPRRPSAGCRVPPGGTGQRGPLVGSPGGDVWRQRRGVGVQYLDQAADQLVFSRTDLLSRNPASRDGASEAAH